MNIHAESADNVFGPVSPNNEVVRVKETLLIKGRRSDINLPLLTSHMRMARPIKVSKAEEAVAPDTWYIHLRRYVNGASDKSFKNGRSRSAWHMVHPSSPNPWSSACAAETRAAKHLRKNSKKTLGEVLDQRVARCGSLL